MRNFIHAYRKRRGRPSNRWPDAGSLPEHIRKDIGLLPRSVCKGDVCDFTVSAQLDRFS